MKSKTGFRIGLIAIIAAIVIAVYFISEYNERPSHRDYPEIEKIGVIQVVTDLNPIGYFVSGDSIAGYNYELIQALQKYTNTTFKISVENNLQKSFTNLNTGKYDLIARHIPINADLRNEYSFTESTLNNRLILVQRKTEFNNGVAPIRNHLELAKKTLHIPSGAPSILRVRNLSHEIGDSIFIIEDNTYQANQLAMMVAAGEIDYTVCDIKTAQNLSEKIPELDIKTDIGFTHFEGWAVRATSPILLDSLNSWIKKLKETKEYNRILKKYYK